MDIKTAFLNGDLDEEVYIKQLEGFVMPEGYSDASWINHVEDSSSTSGWVFLLGGGTISWASKKQTCITGSTMESEFVALAAAGARTKRITYVNMKFCRFKKLGLGFLAHELVVDDEVRSCFGGLGGYCYLWRVWGERGLRDGGKLGCDTSVFLKPREVMRSSKTMLPNESATLASAIRLNQPAFFCARIANVSAEKRFDRNIALLLLGLLWRVRLMYKYAAPSDVLISFWQYRSDWKVRFLELRRKVVCGAERTDSDGCGSAAVASYVEADSKRQ
ncbi:hypothetical protein Tco_1056946 [Tanacetum coccineum]|uniref:Reverse transcriptase Ty1/copia-type domain-containing protein n=1 Tax=Tanacetum coccineum TaxID=301880 RepID=A0ABQ5H591_9ASTR